MHRFFILITLISLLTACGLGGEPAPADHFYRIPEIVISPQDKSLIDTLVVKPVKASGLYHERAMLYIEKSRPLEIQRNHYHFWYKPPADLVLDALYQGLSSSKVAQQVSRVQMNQRPSYIVDSQIMKFERVLEGNEVSVQVRLEVTFIRPDNPSAQSTKYYQSNQLLQTNDKHTSAEAYGAALQDIVKQIVNDILLKK